MDTDLRASQLFYHLSEQVDYSDQKRMESLKITVLKIATDYKLDPNWVYAIILQESAGKHYHIRYEPKYKYLFRPEFYAKKLGISLATEVASQMTSWGVGQIMGALAREQLHGGLMAELIQWELNIKHICIRITALMRISINKDDIFAMYNGGPGILAKSQKGYFNQEYVDGVNRYLKQEGNIK